MANNLAKQPGLDLGDRTTRTSRARPSRPRANGSVGNAAVDAHVEVVAGVSLIIHPLIGLTADDLAPTYRAEIDEELDRLRRNQPPAFLPQVTRIGDSEQLGGVTHIPTVIAAIERGREDGRCILPVVMVEKLNGAAFLTTRMGGVLGATHYEQAKMVRAIDERFGSRREWMRAEGLSPDKWDLKCSKVSKLLDLDESIQTRVDMFTISNVKLAGKIVDAWKDEDRRKAMKDVLANGVRANARIAAGPLFKQLLAVVEPSVASPDWAGEDTAHRTLRDSKGTPLAVLRRDDGGWTLESVDQTQFDRSLLEMALKALKA